MSSSWFPFNFSLPSIQNIAPSLSIQRRFVSFILKRSLGHLLKPGQLDINQIDAQIGNGSVEIKDLELNESAINSFLTDAPVQLLSGSIGSVIVRIPWPNPFLATIGLSMSGLKVEVCVTDKKKATETDTFVSDLSQSVASVAETFLHEELSQREESELRNSVHEEFTAPGNFGPVSMPPGSLDQFQQNSSSPLASDPEGISIFAGLLERLLARFDFDANATQITLVNPRSASFTLRVERIAYAADGMNAVESVKSRPLREKRTVQITGIKITMKELEERDINVETLHPSSDTISHVPPDSSDSELDEDTQMMMSQSLVTLPPRPGQPDARPSSPALSTISSAASSLYQSAISASAMPSSRPETPVVHPDSPTVNESYAEQTLLMLPDPIILQLTTPPAYVPADAPEAGPSTQPVLSPIEPQSSTKYEIEVSMGTIAVALHCRNVKAILQLLDAFPKSQAAVTQPNSGDGKPSPSMMDCLELSLHCKGFVVLMLGSSKDAEAQEGKDPAIDQFFSRPLSQAYLRNGYVRLHVDNINATTSLRAPTSPATLKGPAVQPVEPYPDAHSISMSISDLSILAFHAVTTSSVSSSSAARNVSSPVLISDINLTQSYYTHQHGDNQFPTDHHLPNNEEERSNPLPVFDVIDWTKEKERNHGTSLRPWRAKAHSPSSHRTTLGRPGASIASKVGLSTSPTRSSHSFLSSSPPQARPLPSAQSQLPQTRTSAISLAVSIGENGTGVVIRTVALHVFLDLRAVETILEFVDGALPSPSATTTPTEMSSPVYTEGHSFARAQFTEGRIHMAQAVSDDLELELNYRDIDNDEIPKLETRKQKASMDIVSVPPKNNFRLELSMPLLRVEVRAPCPRNRQPRSGSLVLDLHSIQAMTGMLKDASMRQRSVRMEGEEGISDIDDWINGEREQIRTMVKLGRVVLAYAPLQETKAQSLLSIGSLEGPDNKSIDKDTSTTAPLILLRSLNAGNGPQTESSALVVHLPSLHATINKPLLDGLQLWVDDVSQWSERSFANNVKSPKTSTNTSPTTTRNPSLIGSRYFVPRAGSGATESDLANTLTPKNKQEFVVKVIVSEAFARLIIPIVTPTSAGLSRYLDLSASGLDSLVEIKPDGKDETVISLNVRDTNVQLTTRNLTHTLLRSNANINRKSSVIRMRVRSVVLPGTAAKESRINISLHGLRVDLLSELEWISDILVFVKNPPGTFESVIPSERTSFSGHVMECALSLTPTSRSSSLVLSLGDIEASTELIGESTETSLKAFVGRMSILLNCDNELLGAGAGPSGYFETDAESWMKSGYALLVALNDLDLQMKHDVSVTPPDTRIGIGGMKLCAHLCADTIAGIVLFVTDIQSQFSKEVDEAPKPKRRPADVSDMRSSNVMRSLDESAFRRAPVIGPLPDMIDDDLPTNPEYLDASFGAAAGLRPIDDDDDEFYPEDDTAPSNDSEKIVSRHGGETIKMFTPTVNYVEHFYDTLTPSSVDYASEHGETSTKVRAEKCEIHVLLYDGYDWERTRRAIEEEVKRVKRRLAKIRQLLANGQTYDPNVDELNTVLFNSVYVGLDQEAEEYERDALMAAIDEELNSNTDVGSESSWQSFSPGIAAKPERYEKTNLRSKKHKRAKSPSIEFSVDGMALEFDQYRPGANLASRLLFTIKDLEILDHIRTSTWSKFLSGMRSDSRGNVRETDSNMVRVELQMILPYKGRKEQEARLKAKILPIRLHVDQDALDFLKKFFAFKDPDATPSAPAEDEIFFQHVEIFPVDLKLDYKPRRVDYRALKEGKTIELMNFFHFDGAEMTLRHLTLKGITGWPRMADTLNDLWTPDVKANQLAEVISGVSPIRSAVNVGSGVADLILLPIAQYKKDGRIIRGLQKGTTAFVKSTAIEAIRLGAQLATGTQVVLEQAESVLGGQYKEITTETVALAQGQANFGDEEPEDEDSEGGDLISKYAEQPTNITEGVQSAYRSLSQNIKSAGQTILAVPMEVYERSGKEGPARAVIRAVPIAVLKPLIGASEAVSKTLLGIHGTLNPDAQLDTAVKYKHR